jgi:hypothetical protein
MRKIGTKLKKEILSDPTYTVCSRRDDPDHYCEGRITWEHAIIYAGKQVNEKWAIIPLCAKAHSVDEFQDGGDLDKDRNVWIALNRATSEELYTISKAINYVQVRSRLNQRFGMWVQPIIPKLS